MKPRPWFRSAWAGATALFAVGLVAFFARAIFSHGMLFLGDIAFFYYPVFAYATNALRTGTIPLWCPELEGGMPFLGFWEGTFLYPPDMLFRLVGQAWVGFNASLLFHYLLAGVGMLCYSRRLAFAPLPALAAATVYTFNGFMVTHLEHVNMVVAAAWMPWLFLVVDRLWERPRVPTWAMGGGILAFQLLGGHPDVFLMSTFALGLYTLLHPTHGLLFQNAARRLAAPVALLTAVYLLGIALAAGQLLPTLTLAASSWTQPQERVTTQTAASLNSWEFWQLLLPDLMGRVGDDTHFGLRSYWERCGYAGSLTLVLALVGLASRHRMRLFWLACAGLGLLCAMGPRSLLFSLVRELPAFGTMRLPSRWLFLFDFGVALLAGAGLQALVQARDPVPRRGLWWAAAATAVLTLVSLGLVIQRLQPDGSWLRTVRRETWRLHQFHPFDESRWMATYHRRLSNEAVGLGIALLLGNALIWSRLRSAAALPSLATLGVAALSLDLFHFGAGYNPVFPGAEVSGQPRTARTIQERSRSAGRERLARATPQSFQVFTIEHRGFWPDYSDVTERREFLEMLPGNWNLLDGLPAFGQNDTALRIEPWRRLRAAVYLRGRTPERRLALESRLWSSFNVGYLVSWHKVALPGIVPLTPGHPYLYRVSGNEGRAFFRSRAEHLDHDQGLYERLVNEPELLPNRVFICRDKPDRLGRMARRLRARRMWRAGGGWGTGAATISPPHGEWHPQTTGASPTLTPARPTTDGRPFAGHTPRRPWDTAGSTFSPVPSTPPPPLVPDRSGRVRVVVDEPHRVELEVRALRPGYVVLTDTFYPGWRARVDGRSVPILRANGVHRAVATAAGTHRIAFLYRPAAPRLGFFLSLLTLAACLGLVSAAIVSRPRDGP
jgi:hypothetical protein